MSKWLEIFKHPSDPFRCQEIELTIDENRIVGLLDFTDGKPVIIVRRKTECWEYSAGDLSFVIKCLLAYYPPCRHPKNWHNELLIGGIKYCDIEKAYVEDMSQFDQYCKRLGEVRGKTINMLNSL